MRLTVLLTLSVLIIRENTRRMAMLRPCRQFIARHDYAPTLSEIAASLGQTQVYPAERIQIQGVLVGQLRTYP